ncbi:hypothetical protein ACJX0J_027921, partial [Zea mays]
IQVDHALQDWIFQEKSVEIFVKEKSLIFFAFLGVVKGSQSVVVGGIYWEKKDVSPDPLLILEFMLRLFMLKLAGRIVPNNFAIVICDNFHNELVVPIVQQTWMYMYF